MKNRLSTFLMVLLTVFMVTCKSCKDPVADPVIEGNWTIKSVTSSLGASAVQTKYSAALLGTFEIGAVCNLKAVTTGAITGTGAGTIVTTDATSGTLTVKFADGDVKFTYSGLTANDVTLIGNVTGSTTKTTINNHTIVLSRL